MSEMEEEKVYEGSIAKAKKNLIYFGIFGIVMFFGGLSSAYIVLLGDTFWVSFKWPSEFWISTVVLAISSVTMILAVRSAKSSNLGGLKIFLGVTLFLGLLFTYLQFQGYRKLTDEGNFFVSNIIIVDGKYDDYYYFTYKNEKIEFDGYDYTINGEEISETQLIGMREMSGSIALLLKGEDGEIPADYGKDYMMFYENQPVTVLDGKFYIGNNEIQDDPKFRMQSFTMNLHRGFGDFFMRGRYGEDFYLNYRGMKLDYVDRELQSEDGKKLTVGMMNKLVDTRNLASTFLYMLSALHILHLLGGLIYLMVLFRKSLKKSINSNNIVGLKNGAIYWHFLDLLWIYLIIFLNFIH